MRISDLAGATVGAAVSGGLDSCTITRWLVEEGVAVAAVTANLGQPDETNIDDIAVRMRTAGACDADIVDARQALARAGLEVIQAQARYEGGYWNTTGIARYVTVAALLPPLLDRGISVLTHGCTGRGNDQVRFQLAANMLAPQVQVYAPWRDPLFLEQFPGRREMIAYCEQEDIPIRATLDKPYSTDANLLGLTHEAGRLEDLDTPPELVTPGMGVFPRDAPDQAQTVTIRFEDGAPVALDGEHLPLLEVFLRANAIGGAHGLGIGLHTVENRFVGIKSRGVYEAPGMELLGRAYEYLLQLILDRRARPFFDSLSASLARQIYEGYWFDLASTAMRRAVGEITRLATGTIHLNVYRGHAQFAGAENVPHSLYTDASSMEGIGDFDHVDSEGFLGVLGVSARAAHAARQTSGS